MVFVMVVGLVVGSTNLIIGGLWWCSLQYLILVKSAFMMVVRDVVVMIRPLWCSVRVRVLVMVVMHDEYDVVTTLQRT